MDQSKKEIALEAMRKELAVHNLHTFKTGIYLDDWWIAGMEDFMSWLYKEQRSCIPKGPCGQDNATTSGTRGLMYKYPTFDDAYTAWANEMRKEAGKL